MVSNLKRFSDGWMPALYMAVALLFFAGAFAGGYLIATPKDAWTYTYPLKLYYVSTFFNHGIHRWLPYEFLGMPFVGMMQSACFYPLNFIYFFMPASFAFNFNLIFHFALAGFFTFLYARSLNLSPLPSFLAGILFGLCGFMVAHQDHVSLQNAAAWMPLLLFFYEKIRTTLQARYAAAAAVVVAVQVYAGHYQICMMTYLVTAAYAVFFFFGAERRARRAYFLLCAAPIVLGTMIALPQILPTLELTRMASHADYNFAEAAFGSFHPGMLPMILSPFLFGGGYAGPYFGPPYLIELSGFSTILGTVIAVWAFVKFRRFSAHVLFWGWAAVAAVILAFGQYTPVYRFLSHVPGVTMFRVPARHWFEFDFAVAVLFAFGFDKLLQDSTNRSRKPIQAALAGAAVVLIPWDLRAPRPAVVIPLLFIILYIVSLFKKRWPPVVVLIFLAEIYSFTGFFDRRWIPAAQADAALHSPELTFLKEHAGEGRYVPVEPDHFSLVPGEPLFNVPAKVERLSGYDPLFIKEFLSIFYASGVDPLETWTTLLLNRSILSLFGTRFIVIPKALDLSAVMGASGPDETPGLTNLWTREPSYSLKSGDEVSQKIVLKSGHYYLLLLKAKSANAASKLVFSLDGSRDLNRSLWTPEILSKDWRLYTKVVFIPTDRLSTAALFTHSNQPIEVKDIWIVDYPRRSISSSGPLYRKVFETGDRVIYQNNASVPKAFSVLHLKAIDRFDDLLERLYLLRMNPRTTAAVSRSDLSAIGQSEFSPGEVTDEKYDTDEVILKTQFAGTGFVVLDDQYYPGWHAYLDGAETRIYKTDGLLRGVIVPGGPHRLLFHYR